MKSYDVIVVGAGPVGLYAGFYAGMRGLSVAIIDVSEEAGGQPAEIYPEKAIYDIAGIPKISGSALAQNLVQQLDKVDHDLRLGEKVERVVKTEAGFEVTTSQDVLTAKGLLLTTGNGQIVPRTLGVEGEEAAHAAGRLAYFVRDLESYRGKSVAVLGGGDSALDWALMLQTVAREVHLVHRRDAFRAHEKTVEEVKASKIIIHTPYTAKELMADGILLAKVKSEETLSLSVDRILVTYGFLTQPEALMEGLELNRNGRMRVDGTMASSISGLYGAGDSVDYEGKIPLISVGFGEAVTAISAMTRTIDFEKKLNAGHSSTLFEEEKV
ncbi:MAG: NAD(P)/FAD-dependent oxidoreductase [Streptococcaceae bacterium]|jgi:thioredoxin reductase (NADPH)|nr:NAD(P)/FAD-dependent oxidoreductase [Streptococcaceae bacterium]